MALEKNENLKNGIQIIGLLLLLFVIFIPRTLQVHYYWPQVVHSLYLTFGKIIFVIGVSLIATPSLLGIKNDLALFLLDTKLFNFTSKISFWTYLIHYMLILLVCYSQKVDFYYNILDVLSLYLGVVVMSMICGFLGTMIVEVPFAKI